MVLSHSTGGWNNLEKILQQGILPHNHPQYTGYPNFDDVSKPNRVYLTWFASEKTGLTEQDVSGIIRLTDSQYGSHHLLLKDQWVREHASQLREYSATFWGEFRPFLKEYGIEALPENPLRVRGFSTDISMHQIVSLEPVPPDAISTVVLGGFSMESLRKEEKKRIRRIKTLSASEVVIYVPLKGVGYFRWRHDEQLEVVKVDNSLL